MSQDLADTMILASNQSGTLSENQEDRRVMRRLEFRFEQERKLKREKEKLERLRRDKMRRLQEEMRPY